jgi:GNAT superfamily N-acetyltransferase
MSPILVANDIQVDVRGGTVADGPLLLAFIQSMAAFGKLTVSATEESLRAALFGDAPAARTPLAFVNGKPIAYATYFFTFATMVGGRGLWLDDVFIDPAFRGKGIGRTLMAYLAQIADCLAERLLYVLKAAAKTVGEGVPVRPDCLGGALEEAAAFQRVLETREEAEEHECQIAVSGEAGDDRLQIGHDSPPDIRSCGESAISSRCKWRRLPRR